MTSDNAAGEQNGGWETIYTIVHSTRAIEEFVKILRAYRIEAIADVRRFPVAPAQLLKGGLSYRLPG